MKTFLKSIFLILTLIPTIMPIGVNGQKVIANTNSTNIEPNFITSTACGDITADSYNEPQCSDIPIEFKNSSFEEPEVTYESDPGFDEFDQTEVPGWNTTDKTGLIQIFGDSPEGLESYKCTEGKQCAELNAEEEASLYQDFNVTPGQTLYYSFDHIGRTSEYADQNQTVDLRIGAPRADSEITDPINPVEGGDENIVAEDTVAQGKANTVTGEYSVPTNLSNLRLAFSSTETAHPTTGNGLDDVRFVTKAVYDNSIHIIDSDGLVNDNTYTIDNKITNVQGDNQADSTLTYTFNYPVEVKSANITFNDDTESSSIDSSAITTDGEEVKIKVPQTAEEKNAKDFEVEMEVKSLDPIDTMQSISVTSEFDFSSEVEKAQDSEANSYSVIDSDEAEISLIPIKNIADVCKDESCDSGTAFKGTHTIDAEPKPDPDAGLSIKGLEYKINAQTNELMVQAAFNEEIPSDDNVLMNVVDDSDNTVTIDSSEATELGQNDSGNYVYEYDTGELRSKLETSGEYSINFKDNGETLTIPLPSGKKSEINIEVPKTVEYGGKVYSEIGDGVNPATDNDNVSNADVVSPDSVDTYGIYELESIGYEEANSIDNTKIWDDTNDLTLTKYDHVIRPIDGNYVVADKIDGSISKSNTAADNAGGFKSDGYRPIGQKVGTQTGEDSVSFTGSLTGDVDTVLGSSEDNTYISDMYINEPEISNVGMISQADGASISNLGIVDPNITGNNNVGSFIGTVTNMNLENTYTVDKLDDFSNPTYEIKGDNNVGGIVGSGSQLSIKSTDNFNGKIPRIDLTGDVQPSNNPDKDGYKTFSTVDVQGTGNDIGGIIGKLENQSDEGEQIDKAYNKGIIYTSGNNVGGIAGYGFNITVLNSYNSLNFEESMISGASSVGGIVGCTESNSSTEKNSISNSYNNAIIESSIEKSGGITGSANSILIKNVYNSGNILSKEKVGGITGNTDDKTSISIINAYNVGIISGDDSFVGGIAGDTVNNAHANHNEITSEVVNCLNGGNIIQTKENDAYTGSIIGDSNANVVNSYNYENVVISGTTDSNISEDFYQEVTAESLKDDNWYKNELGFDDNWNISAEDAERPVPDVDADDESSDDEEGTIPVMSLPNLEEKNNKLEIHEQVNTVNVNKSQKQVEKEKKNNYVENVKILNYEVDQNNLNITFNIQIKNIQSNTLTFKFYNNGDNIDEDIPVMIAEQQIKDDLQKQKVNIKNDGKLLVDNIYDVYLLEGDTVLDKTKIDLSHNQANVHEITTTSKNSVNVSESQKQVEKEKKNNNMENDSQDELNIEDPNTNETTL